MSTKAEEMETGYGTVDLYISNDRHHVAMVRPIIRCLRNKAHHRVRIVSVCEVRGVSTPRALLESDGADVHALLGSQARTGKRSGIVKRSIDSLLANRWCRSMARKYMWGAHLQWRIEDLLSVVTPAVTVVPNDASYPFEDICALLKTRGVPVILLQEGLRFTDSSTDEYGTKWVDTIAAWGPSSMDYFAGKGVPAERVHLTGSPRYDSWTDSARRSSSNDGVRSVALATNPVENLGLCSPEERFRTVGSFIDAVSGDEVLDITLRPHPGEDAAAYAQLLAASEGSNTRLDLDTPIRDLLMESDAVVVLASTVGLEGMLLGTPVGVLPIPGCGYVHDSVGEGAGMPLVLDATLPKQVRLLASGRGTDEDSVERYLDRHLTNRGRAADAVAELILQIGDMRPSRR